jgi:hypothetical protein
LDGDEWTIALGGQSIANASIHNANVSGTSTGAAYNFYSCTIGAVTVAAGDFHNCCFTGTVTVGAAGDFLFDTCCSQVAGAGTPTLDLGAAIGGTTVSFRRWSGGLTLNNVQAGDTISVDAISGGTITVNGTGGTVNIRGMVAVSDGSSGAVTIVQTQAIRNLMPPKNVALSDIEFLMVDATDFATPEPGLTVSGTRSLDGGAFGAVTGTIAEVANGIYQFDASAADMNGTIITFRFTATGAADRFLTIRTTG